MAGTEQGSHGGQWWSALPLWLHLGQTDVRSDFLEEDPSATESHLDLGPGGGSLLFLSHPGPCAPWRGGCCGEESPLSSAEGSSQSLGFRVRWWEGKSHIPK